MSKITDFKSIKRVSKTETLYNSRWDGSPYNLPTIKWTKEQNGNQKTQFIVPATRKEDETWWKDPYTKVVIWMSEIRHEPTVIKKKQYNYIWEISMNGKLLMRGYTNNPSQAKQKVSYARYEGARSNVENWNYTLKSHGLVDGS